MFVSIAKSGYTHAGSQYAHGNFLILFDDDEAKVAIGGEVCARCGTSREAPQQSIGASSADTCAKHTGDGLPARFPRDADDPGGIPDAARPYLHPVPAELARQYWNGGGHNNVGREAPALRDWARANFRALKNRRPRA